MPKIYIAADSAFVGTWHHNVCLRMTVKADLGFQVLDTRSIHLGINLRHKFIGHEILSHNRNANNYDRLIERLLHLDYQNTGDCIRQLADSHKAN